MPEEPDFRLVLAGEPPEPDGQTDTLYDDEKKSLDNARLRADVERLLQQNEDLVQDRNQRKKYATRLFRLIVGWLIVSVAIVLLHGFPSIPFKLSGTVLVTLIGSTTASVLGLFAIVANYLFPKR
jgi:hypothetical protein